MRIPLIFTLLFGAGVVIGYGLGNLRSQPIKEAVSSDGTPVVALRNSSAPQQRIDPAANVTGASEIFSSLVTAAQEKEYLKGRVAMYRLLERVSSSDIPALLDSAQQLPPELRKTLMAAIVEHWLKVDVTAAGAWISSRSNDRVYLDAWANASPLDTLKTVLASKEDMWYRDAPRIALERLAGNDPLAWISVLTSLPANGNRDKLLEGAIRDLAKSSPSDALQVANNNLTGKARTAATHAVLLEWGKTDPAAAIAQVESLLTELKPSIRGNEFISEFARSMAEKDPLAAAEFAASLPEEFRKYPLIAAATAWAKTDTLNALKWSLENGVPITTTFRTGWFSLNDTVLRSALKTQPEETIRWLIDLPSSQERSQFLRSAMWDQLRKDNAATELLSESGSSIRRLFKELPLDEQVGEAGLLGKVIVGKGTFPDEAVWRSLFPNEAVRAQAIASAIGTIFSQSATRADAMVAELPEGLIRDLALKEITSAQSYVTPDAAVKRALQISSKDVQRSALDRVVPGWLVRNEAACRAWLDSAKEIPASWVAEWSEVADWIAKSQAP